MCRFQIILQCLLIIADSAAVVAHLLCPLGKTAPPLSYRELLVILMLIKHPHQCTCCTIYNKSTVNKKQNPFFPPLHLCQGHSPSTFHLLTSRWTISSRTEWSQFGLFLLLCIQPVTLSCRSSIWLSPVLGACKQRLTQWLSWWQRARQGCGNTVMIKLFWMVPQ